MTDRFDAIVIGAGHNGLVCAGYLARAGLKVACIESRDTVGGMAAPRMLGPDYQLPGLAHAAYPMHPRIRRDLGLDRLGYRPGSPIDTVSLGTGGDHVVIGAAGITGSRLPAGDMERYPQFRRRFLDFARSLRPLFENRPPRLANMSFRDKCTLAALGWNVRMRLGRESMYEFLRVAAINVHDVLDEAFEDDRLKGALAADAVLGSAMGPRTPGSVLAWLQRLYGAQHGPLAVVSIGQTGLIEALRRSAEASGVSIRPATRVEQILTVDDRAVGVGLSDGGSIEAGVVVSNADPRTTLLDLVGAPRLDALFAHRVGQIRGSGTVAKLYLALAGLPEFAGLDRASIGNRLLVSPSTRYAEQAFNRSKYGEYSGAPVLEITIPSVHDESLAPQGHHVMSVNAAFMPYRLAGGWDRHRNEVADMLVQQLEAFAPGIRSLIVDREFLTPQDIEAQYSAVEGHWHHGEITMHQSFMMRPVYGASQYDTPIQGLFLCSAGCHPGGGLTGLPGRNAAKRILEYRGAS